MNRHLLLSFLLGSLLGPVAGTAAADPAPKPTQQLGVYRWGSPKGPPQVDLFEQWIGVPVWGEDFQGADTWDNIRDPAWQLPPWQKWVEAKEGRRLILSVPLLPGKWDLSGPGKGTGAKVPVSLEAGARGEYNAHFKLLAERLVQFRLEKSVLRLGWEFNGGWYAWRAGANPQAFAEYFRQIVKTMRAVDGAKFEFCWNPATDNLQFPAEQAYPGDQFVDVIGIDVYDQSWMPGTYPFPKDATPEDIAARQKKAWHDWVWNGGHGLKFWRDYTLARKKPLAICEWGLCLRDDGHGGGDNAYFMEKMAEFIQDPANKVSFHVYFDVQAGDGHHQISPGPGAAATPEFPKATEVFRKHFGPK